MAEQNWPTVLELERAGVLLVQDGNHGEYRPRPNEFVDSGVAFIRAADMSEGRVLFDTASKVNAVAARRITKGIGQPGDVILSHKGTVGKVAIVPSDAPSFVCSPQTTFWRALDEKAIDRRFLYVFLRSPVFHSQLASRSGETDMAPYVSLTSQRGFRVAMPALEDQQAIGSIVGAFDDKIELNRRMSETLEAMARAIFRDWFVDFGPTRAKMEGRTPYLNPDVWTLFPDRLDEDEIPKGWEWAKLCDLADLNPREKLRQGSDALYLDMAALPTQGPSADRPVQRAAGPGARFRNADTLMARITPCLENGKTAFVQCLPDGQIGWGSTEFIVIRTKAPLPAEYGYLLARDEMFRAHAIQSMTGTSGRQRAQAEALARFEVVKPSEAVALCLGAQVAPMFEKIAANAEENETLAATRDLLIPKLMSGEIRIRDAEAMAAAAA